MIGYLLRTLLDTYLVYFAIAATLCTVMAGGHSPVGIVSATMVIFLTVWAGCSRIRFSPRQRVFRIVAHLACLCTVMLVVTAGTAHATSVVTDGDTITLITASNVLPLVVPFFSLLANVLPKAPTTLWGKLAVKIVDYCALNFRVSRPAKGE